MSNSLALLLMPVMLASAVSLALNEWFGYDREGEFVLISVRRKIDRDFSRTFLPSESPVFLFAITLRGSE